MSGVTEGRKRVLVLAGGVSGEHAISLRSAATVIDGLEAAGHSVTTVGITREGTWLLGDLRRLVDRARTELVEVLPRSGRPVALVNDGSGPRLVALDGSLVDAALAHFDLVFPVLHGPGGEDGTVQGLLEIAGARYVGAGPTASALAMDKLAMKTMCAGAAVPQVEFLSAGRMSATELAARIEQSFGMPCFVKPANLGSSVGISRVRTTSELPTALAEARRWDPRVIIERAVDAREIEVALLGNEAEAEVSPPGEIVSAKGFYDFASKYVDADDARLIAPAELPATATEEIRAIALEVWEMIGCRGMARCDFFVERASGRVLFNEINTIPGMTSISMFPRLFALVGLDNARLFDRLVQLALAAGTESLSPRTGERAKI